ncbi:MAG: cytochrome C [Anaerolineales bacterium]|nr:cytochrome c [Anaerolineae bacterium]PWB53572.1 MAG: cytochrome C [Anaerolineales bacterium]
MIARIHGSHAGVIYIPLVFLLFGIGVMAACASSSQINLDGQEIFAANCSSCHTIGRGNLVGPDLIGVTDQQSQKWLIDFISNPDQMITSGDTRANQLLQQFNFVVMPNMGLTTDQILAVLDYLKAESGLVMASPVGTSAQVLPAGDPNNGRALFLGDIHLKNGAPFCIGCHNNDDTGILGGGTLGPDLTEAFTKYGDAGLEEILSNLPFPTMRLIFSNHTLTISERADIRAFLKESAGKPVVNKEPWIILISLVGFGASLIAFAFIWRNRLQGVRKELLNNYREKK